MGKESVSGRNIPKRADRMTVDGERKLKNTSEVVNLDDLNM